MTTKLTREQCIDVIRDELKRQQRERKVSIVAAETPTSSR